MDKELRLTLEIINKTKKGIDDVVKGLDRVEQSAEGVNRAGQKAAGGVGDFVKGIIGARVVMGTFNTVVDIGRRGLEEFGSALEMGMSFAMMEESLAVIAGNADIGAAELKAMRDELAEINTTGSNATRVMQTFIQTGLHELVQEVEFASGERGFKGFTETVKDFAATAQVSSTQGLKIFTTELGRNKTTMLEQFGITRDLDAVFMEYKDTMGITNRQLTETEKRMALLNLIAEEGERVQGVYNETYDRAAKNMLSLDDAVNTIKETLGSAFEPAIAKVTNDLVDLVKGVRDWIIGSDEQEAHLEQLTNYVSKLATMFRFLTDRLKDAKGQTDMTEAVISFGKFTRAIAAVIQAGEFLVGELRVIIDLVSMVGRGIGNLRDSAIVFFDSLARFDPAKPFETAEQSVDLLKAGLGNLQDEWHRDAQVLRKDWNLWREDALSLGEILNYDVRKAWEESAETAEKSNDDTVKSVRDAEDKIISHTDQMSKQMAEAIEDFNDKMKKSFEDYQDRLFDLVVTHRERIDQLKGDLKEERKLLESEIAEKKRDANEEIKEEKDKAQEKIDILEEEIDRERAANLVNEEQNIQFLQNQIREIEEQRDERIKVIEQSLNEELEIVRESRDERIAEIQAELDEELAIRKKHSEDFAKFKDQEKEDDITRLKQSFKERREEIRKDYAKRLQDQTNHVKTMNKRAKEEVEQVDFTSIIANPLVQSVTSGIERALNKIKNISFEGSTADWLSSTFLKFFDQIPKKQIGAMRSAGGMTLVGERGPELVNLPPSSTISPAQQTREVINNNNNATSNSFNIQVISDKFMGSKVEAREFARQIIREIQDIAQTKAMTPTNLLNSAI